MYNDIGQRTFTLEPAQVKKFKKWNNKHKKTCKYALDQTSMGAVGGRLTFSFIPTGIGCISEIKCACGEVLDVTDDLAG